MIALQTYQHVDHAPATCNTADNTLLPMRIDLKFSCVCACVRVCVCVILNVKKAKMRTVTLI